MSKSNDPKNHLLSVLCYHQRFIGKYVFGYTHLSNILNTKAGHAIQIF